MGLAGIGSLLLMHGLLMPDTPALAALRARIEDIGMSSVLINMARRVNSASGIAIALVASLSPLYDRLFETLLQQAGNGPGFFHRAQDNEHGPEAFMAEWMASLDALNDFSASEPKPDQLRP